MRHVLVFLCAILVLIGMGRVANAALITHTYTGSVTRLDGELSGGTSPFALGQTFTISYMFDSTTPDSDANPQAGRYSAITSFTAQVGSYTATATAGSIEVLDDLSGDSYSAGMAGSITGAPVNFHQFEQAFLLFIDPGGAGGPISNDLLPITPYDPNDFTDRILELDFLILPILDTARVISDNPTVVVSGGAPIPEPGTLLLLGSGVVGMGAMARRRKRRK